MKFTLPVKKCTSCGKLKPLPDFHKNGNTPRSQCKDCTNRARRYQRKEQRHKTMLANAKTSMEQLSILARIALSEPLNVYHLREQLGDIVSQEEALRKQREGILNEIERELRAVA